jgi:hypothetical protein
VSEVALNPGTGLSKTDQVSKQAAAGAGGDRSCSLSPVSSIALPELPARASHVLEYFYT